MKTCNKCFEEKSLESYHKDKNSPDGKRYTCKECASIAGKAYTKTFSEEKRQELAKRQRRYRKEDPARFKEYEKNKRERHSEKIKERNKAWRLRNKEYIKKKNKEWRDNNLSHILESNARRKAKRIRATPAWLSDSQIEEMRDIYQTAKDLEWLNEEPLHVDHIVPIQGKDVCGLHVPWNLQILTASKNLSKGVKYARQG